MKILLKTGFGEDILGGKKLQKTYKNYANVQFFIKSAPKMKT